MQYTRQTAYLGIALAALAACGVQDSGKPGGPVQMNSVQLLQRITQIAGQANAASPAAVDPDTRLDGAKVGPGLRLTSRYTLVNAESQGLTTATFETKLAAVIKDGSCQNPELRPLIDQGVLVVLEYRALDGSPIGTISINRDTCSAMQNKQSTGAPSSSN